MKLTIYILLSTVASFYTHAQDNRLFNANVDLNGDGEKETIRLVELENYQYVLQINNLKENVQFGLEGFKIIDADTTDVFKEIIVFTSGPSDDYEYEIFRYQNDSIHLLGHLEGWITVNGDGTLFTDNGEGFWSRRDVFFLNNTTLSIGKFPFKNEFYVGVKATVTTEFQIFNDPNTLEPFIKIKASSQLTILTATLVEMEDGFFEFVYQVVTEDGLLGYTQLIPLLENTEGLIMAD